MGLKADDPRSPYLQIAEDLREQIRTGRLTPGDRIAPSRELEKYYEVARMTVQHALDLLKAEDLIFSNQGRGTFVRSDINPAEIHPPAGAPDQSSTYRRLSAHIERIEGSVRELEERVRQIEGERLAEKASRPIRSARALSLASNSSISAAVMPPPASAGSPWPTCSSTPAPSRCSFRIMRSTQPSIHTDHHRTFEASMPHVCCIPDR
jgi:DNA-binding transcriptional regulator YhcF (GntR family)